MSIVPRFDPGLIASYFESAEKFPVPLDGLWQEAGYARKDGAVKQLKSEFLEGVDFCSAFGRSVDSSRVSGSGGHNQVNYFLSADAAKIFCLRARTDRGVEIARLFVAAYEELKAKLTATLAQPLSLVQQAEMFLAQAKEQERLALVQSQQQAQIEKQQQQINQIAAEVDRNQSPQGHYFSVLGYANLIGVPMDKALSQAMGKRASKLCRDGKFQKGAIRDPHYGSIGTYPQEILQIVFVEFGFIQADSEAS